MTKQGGSPGGGTKCRQNNAGVQQVQSCGSENEPPRSPLAALCPPPCCQRTQILAEEQNFRFSCCSSETVRLISEDTSRDENYEASLSIKLTDKAVRLTSSNMNDMITITASVQGHLNQFHSKSGAFNIFSRREEKSTLSPLFTTSIKNAKSELNEMI